MRKRKKLLRLAIASGLLAIFALPSAAFAYPAGDEPGKGQTSSGGICAGLDPWARSMDARICNDTREVPSGETNFGSVDNDPVPITSSPSDGGLALEWWLVAIGFVAAGAVGLIISLREGPRPLT
jgi:hypothetical protein